MWRKQSKKQAVVEHEKEIEVRPHSCWLLDCWLESLKLMVTENMQCRPCLTLYHWVYLQVTEMQHAGSETGVGSTEDKRFDSYVHLDIS